MEKSRKLARFQDKELNSFEDVRDVYNAVNRRVFQRRSQEKDWNAREHKKEILDLFIQVVNYSNLEINSIGMTESIVNYCDIIDQCKLLKINIKEDQNQKPHLNEEKENSKLINKLRDQIEFQKQNTLTKIINFYNSHETIDRNYLIQSLRFLNIGTYGANKLDLNDPRVKKWNRYYNALKIYAGKDHYDIENWNEESLLKGIAFGKAYKDNEIFDTILDSNNFDDYKKITNEGINILFNFMSIVNDGNVSLFLKKLEEAQSNGD